MGRHRPAGPRPSPWRSPRRSAPAGATASNGATGVDPNGKETASVTGLSATGLGVGAFTVSLYGSNPTGTALSNGTGRFVDVLVATGSQLASLTLTDCDLGAGGNFLSWYDGRHWQAFSEQTKDSPNPGCITAVVDGTTSPTPAQLTGTVVGASDKPTGDFALSLDPTSQILSENSSVLYSVQAMTSSGFTDPVTLTIGDLPTGVTGFFVGSGSNHVTVTPGTPTQLHLSAGQSFTTGTLRLHGHRRRSRTDALRRRLGRAVVRSGPQVLRRGRRQRHRLGHG